MKKQEEKLNQKQDALFEASSRQLKEFQELTARQQEKFESIQLSRLSEAVSSSAMASQKIASYDDLITDLKEQLTATEAKLTEQNKAIGNMQQTNKISVLEQDVSKLTQNANQVYIFGAVLVALLILMGVTVLFLMKKVRNVQKARVSS